MGVEHARVLWHPIGSSCGESTQKFKCIGCGPRQQQRRLRMPRIRGNHMRPLAWEWRCRHGTNA
eukprot:230627-Pleurochrysis_carterae.AAC.1